MNNESANVKLSWRERIAFGQIDLAGLLVYNMITVYLSYFLTDVAMIPIGVAGAIMLIARIFDAVDAPIWGVLIDMTDTRWGKARPYFLWIIFPFTLFGILLFWVPDWSLNAKIIYFTISYIFANVLYTGLNTPLATILPLLTSNVNERATLNSVRLSVAQIGVLIVNVGALPMVHFFGHGDEVIGFRWTIVILALAGMVLTLISFANIKERVKPKIQKIKIKDSFKAMKGNCPWILIIISNLFFWTAMTARSSTLVYYLTYNYGHQHVMSLVNGLSILQVVTTVLVPLLNRKFYKRTLWIFGFLFLIGGQLIVLLGGKSLPIIIIGWIIGSLGVGLALSQAFVLIGSAVDYGEWKTGINAAGLLTAFGTTFCTKMGTGIGGAIPTQIMSLFGYNAGHTQTAHSLLGISISFIWVPILFYALGIIPMLFYRKYEGMEGQINRDLAAARQ
ncbi:glycoside-pentoside-hexuronide (GPH):cation symporter [Weissella bombi]|uniref:Sugar (Glycoside-Pentoside-Hexuronide) transporter n=1 Tax=Weissella bombi TaxID=1505725 RepID=A0A1C3YZR1_9LACO|nr:glycoside-pentoside-hexuronide (GPH):cation symporter [Weissella bombi]SCB75601.1 sugar (Glycoside-Pentoside-Hexuronide) transporter [Weissella bombi]